MSTHSIMVWTNAMEPVPAPSSGTYSPYHRNSVSQPRSEADEALYRMDSEDGTPLPLTDPK